MNSSRSVPRLKVCFVSTSNYTYQFFLKHQIDRLAQTSDITLIGNDEHGTPDPKEGVRLKYFPIRRQPSPLHDALMLFKIWRFLRTENFDVVYTISPKGGLLGAIAAWLAGTKARIHFFTGQVWVTRQGFWRILLKTFDKIIGTFCSQALIDSPSQMSFLIEQKVLPAHKAKVLGMGSMAGVDCHRFCKNPAARQEIRSQWNLSEDTKVLLFLGRLNRDKGVGDLAQAFVQLVPQHPQIHLLFVGADEGMQKEMNELFEQSNVARHVSFVGQTPTPEKYFQAADIFCLPSYREGFGIVAIEAAACGLPAVTSNIYGLSDAVENGKSGLLHQPKSAADIAEKLSTLLNDDQRRSEMGTYALQRANDSFEQSLIIDEFMTNHESIVSSLVKK